MKQAWANAANDGSKILIFFSSPQSALSNHFSQQVFTDPTVCSLLGNGYLLVRLDFNHNVLLAQKLQVFKPGTVVIYDSKGIGLGIFIERASAEEFAQKLKGL